MPFSQFAARRNASAATIAAVSLFPFAAGSADLYEEPAAVEARDAGFDQGRFGGVRGTLHDWNFVIGAGAMYRPKYEGAKDLEVIPVPMISATIGERVHIDPSGITVDAYRGGGFTLSVKGGYEIGRKEDDDSHLRGLGDVNAGGLVGARAHTNSVPCSSMRKSTGRSAAARACRARSAPTSAGASTA